MFYTIYKITNLLDGKIYIGSHKTKKLDDTYMGSGKYLKAAQKKYGLENFKKEILFVFDTPEEMYAKEAEIVNEDFLATENTYNLKIGGFGGWDYINGDEDFRISKNRKARKLADNSILEKYGVENASQIPHVKELLSASMKRRISEGFKPEPPSFAGKKHSVESRQKMSKKMKGQQAGNKNSQFGTTWVWHELFGNKKIDKNMIVEYIDQGWFKTYKPGYRVVA